MIFDEDGQLLLTKRGQGAVNERGCWEVPGGSIELGETRAEAVVREVMEELGVAVEVVEELHTIDHLIPVENEHWIATPFSCVFWTRRSRELWSRTNAMPSSGSRSTNCRRHCLSRPNLT